MRVVNVCVGASSPQVKYHSPGRCRSRVVSAVFWGLVAASPLAGPPGNMCWRVVSESSFVKSGPKASPGKSSHSDVAFPT